MYNVKTYTAAQMRDIDEYAINVPGISGTVLMARAAEHIAAAALERLTHGGRVAVVCGTGNNGGDGLGAAAILTEKGTPARVFLVGDEEKLTADSREMLSRLTEAGGTLESFANSRDRDIEKFLNSCEVIVDAIFGIGLNSGLRGDALKAAEMINAARAYGAYVIAADIPSGVHADTGAIESVAVEADMTVTFTAAKPGLYIEPGCKNCGEVRIADIGIPAQVVDRF